MLKQFVESVLVKCIFSANFVDNIIYEKMMIYKKYFTPSRLSLSLDLVRDLHYKFGSG